MATESRAPLDPALLYRSARSSLNRQGYVSYADLAREFACSRQAISACFKRALDTGYLTQAEFDAIRPGYEPGAKPVSITLSAENLRYIDELSSTQRVRRGAIVNAVLSDARQRQLSLF